MSVVQIALNKMAMPQNPRNVLTEREEDFSMTISGLNINRDGAIMPERLFPISTVDGIINTYGSRAHTADEVIIRQRGRRRPLTDWTPEQAAASNDSNVRNPFQRTPTKMPLSANVILRSSPRKRLSMGSPLLDLNSPTKHNAKQQLWPETPLAKRRRVCLDVKPIAQLNREIPLATILQGLSHKQLIDLIMENLVSENTNTETELRARLPLPEIDTMEEELLHAKRMIFKSLPTSRLSSKTDNTAYTRASLHLSEFRRLVVKHTKQLNDSAHWDALLDYVIMAWPYVKATPNWDNNIHNTVRRQCFKLLTCSCMTAVKCGGIHMGTTRLHSLEHSLQDWSQDYEDVLSCINGLHNALANRRQSY